MRNVKLIVEYDGTNYHGWQTQHGAGTIQDLLEDILSELDGQPVVVHGASRTDAGAHALGQVASFNFNRDMTERELLRALNGNLMPEIRVRQVEFVDPSFHARFSAQSRIYRFVYCLDSVVSPFLCRFVHHCPYALRIDLMRAVAPVFLGEHDFALFASKHRTLLSSTRTVIDLEFVEHGKLLEMYITANGFFRGMVRRIAGTLQHVGRGKLTRGEVERLLQGDESVRPGPGLPAKGLTLYQVNY